MTVYLQLARATYITVQCVNVNAAESWVLCHMKAMFMEMELVCEMIYLNLLMWLSVQEDFTEP